MRELFILIDGYLLRMAVEFIYNTPPASFELGGYIILSMIFLTVNIGCLLMVFTDIVHKTWDIYSKKEGK